MSDFLKLSVPAEIDTALQKNGITVPTPVQREVVPRILSGAHTAFQSETGTGKTLCYLIPAFMRRRKGAITTLILAPTHELGSQIRQTAANLASDSGLPVTAALCIGGAPLKRQIESLKKKPDILIGGPARILELVRIKKFSPRDIELVVLDEVDRLLSPEMRDLVAELLSLLPATAQYVSCSATLTTRHSDILSSIVPSGSALERIEMPAENVLAQNITHWAFYSERRNKIDSLRRFLVAEKPGKALIFTAELGQVENIASQLVHKGISCVALHAKMDKKDRKTAIDRFRSGKITVLVTSDLAARGLDIPDITHVIQMDVQENTDFFIHRSGRTARAGKNGINAIFGDEYELRSLARLEKKLGIIIYPKALYGGNIVTPEQETPEERDQ